MFEFFLFLFFVALSIIFTILAVRSIIYRMNLNKRVKELENKLDNPDIQFNVAGTEYKKKNIENILRTYIKNKTGIITKYDKETEQYAVETFKYPKLETSNVKLIRDPSNEYDENAIKVLIDENEVGYVPKKTNVKLIKELDNFQLFKAFVSEGTYKDSSNDDEDEKFKIKIIGIKK